MEIEAVFYDAAVLVAVVSILVALVVWITIALQFFWWVVAGKARDESLRRMFKVLLACVLFGAAYGAAFGSFFEPALMVPFGEEPLSAVTRGMSNGALLGSCGGGVAGFFGTVRGRHVGWWLAGVLGSSASAAPLWIVSVFAATWESAPLVRDRIMSDGLLAFSAILLIGGCLGAALNRALRTGSSFVPGVQRLAAMIKGGARPQHEP